MDVEKEIEKISQPLAVEEVTALIRYASEQGIDRKLKDSEKDHSHDAELSGSHQSTILTTLNAAVLAYSDSEKRHEPESANEVIRLYTMLSKMTSPVNGRTLLDTVQSRKTLINLCTITLVLLLMAVAEVVISYWWADAVTPEEGFTYTLGSALRIVLTPISPFLWGGLGACVYLLKRLYDISEERFFDRQRLRGWLLRVLLGAIMGFVVVQLFDLQIVGEGEAPLEANAVAFLVGLGVKVVYGAFEKLVQTMSETLNLQAVRRAQTPASEVHTYLNKKLAEAMDAEDETRTKLYANVIDDLGSSTTKR